MSRLKTLYLEKFIPQMQKSSFKNKMAVPEVDKVIVNVGIGKNNDNEKFIENVSKNIAAITGQKPILKRSKKAISGFKLKVGDKVGLMVTLRKEKMYDFMDKLANIVLPRLRDFRGINRQSFDNGNNITIGIEESVVFPEISHETENIHGLEVTIVTTANKNEDAYQLLKTLGFPFMEQKNG